MRFKYKIEKFTAGYSMYKFIGKFRGYRMNKRGCILKRAGIVLLFAVVFILSNGWNAFAGEMQDHRRELLVKYKNWEERSRVVEELGNRVKVKKTFESSNIELLEVSDQSGMEAVKALISSDRRVEYVQYNVPLGAYGVIQDAKFSSQWALSNTGQTVEGDKLRSGVDINAQSAWSVTEGSEEVVVGVLDTGIDINHPDLKDNIFVNPGEIPDDGIDNDGNGYVDDVNGWDFANGDNTVFHSAAMDEHGTHVAGIIAAAGNETGIRGVAPKIKILPLKFINETYGYTADVIEAIEYAARLGVRIMNCSFGNIDDNAALKDAMKNSGMILVCAAGNTGESVETYPIYPACFDIPNLLSVAAIDGTGTLDRYSGYGSEVHLAAPGVNILSTLPNGNYGVMSGASAAAPHVTGAVALIKSKYPDMNNAAIIKRIKDNVVKCASLQGKVATSGRLDAYAALANTPPAADNTPASAVNKASADYGSQVSLDALFALEQVKLVRQQMHYGESGINPSSGSLSFTCTELSVPSPGFLINIARSYNSRDDREGFMGRGWTFGFEGSITGDYWITAKLPNGNVQVFKKNEADGKYVAYSSRSTLVKNPDGTFTLKTKDMYYYYFNKDGFLYQMSDRHGNSVKLSYSDSKGKISVIEDSAGRKYTLEYNGDNLISAVKDQAGRTVRYNYTNKLLTNVVDAEGNSQRYEYDAQKYLKTIKDTYGKTVLDLEYDHNSAADKDKVRKVTDAYGNVLTYAYDTTNSRTTITDSQGRQQIQWYDSSMYTVKTQDAEGKIEITEYYQDLKDDYVNKYGEVRATVDRNGNRTTYDGRDERGNIRKIINPDMTTREFQFDDENNMISQKDERGNLTYFIFDAEKKKLLKKVQPLDGKETYSSEGNPAGFAVTSYDYYPNGLVKTETDPENTTTTYTYDSYGNLLTVQDPLGKAITYEYQGNNALTGMKSSEESPGKHKTLFAYDNNGLLERITQQGGETTRTVYDKLGRKVQEVLPNQYKAEQDDLANHAYMDNMAGTRYEYYTETGKGYGKVKKTTDAEENATTYEYDLYGNVEKEIRPNGSVYLYEYDKLDRLVKVSFKNNESGTPVVLEEYTYAVTFDGKTQKTQIKHLNETQKAVSVFTWDYAGRLVEQQNPDGGKLVTRYYGNGLKEYASDANGNITYYGYDSLDRLVWESSPADAAGSSLYNGIKTEYDRAGKKVREYYSKEKGSREAASSLNPGNSVVKEYTYYADGKLRKVSDSAGRVTEYAYDDDGNRTGEDVLVTAGIYNTTLYEYNPLGKPLAKKIRVRPGEVEQAGGEPNGGEIYLTTVYTYENGSLKSITTPDNETTTYEYDKLGRQVKATGSTRDELTQEVTVTAETKYNWEGKVTESTDLKGNTTVNTYNQKGLLEKVKNPEGGITAFWYDRAGRKIAEVTLQNYGEGKPLTAMNRSEYTYDLMDRLTAKTEKYTDPVKGSVEETVKAFKYDYNGNVTYEQDGMGVQGGYGTGYTYDGAGRKLWVTDPVSKSKGLTYTVSYSYDGLGRKKSETDARGTAHTYEYNDDGTVKAEYVNGIKIRENSYDRTGNLIKTADGNGNTTEYEYNALGKVKEEMRQGDATMDAYTVTTLYDVMGNPVKKQDSLEVVQTFTYDDRGRQTGSTVKKANGAEATTVSVKYDVNGNRRFETDANNVTREYRYDRLNRRVESSVSAGTAVHTTSYAYDANGNLLEVTDKIQNQGKESIRKNISSYDPINRIIKKIDGEGAVVQKLEYNPDGTQSVSYDAMGNATRFYYDRNGRLVRTVDPEGHETLQDYDEAGNVKTKTDGRGNITAYEYDAFNRLVSVTNPKKEKTSYTYDTNGNLLTQTDGKGNVTTFEYNAANKPAKRIDPGTGPEAQRTEAYTYYADGKLKSKLDRNGTTTTYTYDAQGWLKIQKTPDEETAYIYDGNGNPLNMTDSTGETKRKYDALGRVTEKDVPVIGKTVFTYDILEEGSYTAEKSIDPKGNTTLKAYDRADRLKTVTAEAGTTIYQYNPDGSRKSITYPGGAREEYTYYADNLLKTLVNYGLDGTAMESYSYMYDAAHNQTEKTDNKGKTSYSYDSLNRLEKVEESGGRTTIYGYDAAGNRETETVIKDGSNVTSIYSYNPQNRLTGITARDGTTTVETVYTYDNNGNMISRTESSTQPVNRGETLSLDMAKSGGENTPTGRSVAFYEYDTYNQLTKAEAGGTTATYAYNGDGQRVAKTIKGETTRYLYEYDKVVLETDGSGGQKARNVYGTNLISRTDGGESYFYLYNGHADVTALIDTSGNIAASYYYDAFGNHLESVTDSVYQPIRYAGYQYDEETGNYYLNARMYDPKIARFLQEDTYRGQASDPLSLNLYTYCHNEPIMFIDPTGHWEKGDEKLPPAAQAAIAKLTSDYFKAKDSEKGDIHALAQAIRDNPSAYSNSNVSSTSSSGSSSFYSSVNNEISSKGYLSENKWSSIINNYSAPTNSGTGSVVLFQHGVNADITTFETMVNTLSQYDNCINGGKLSFRKSTNDVTNTQAMSDRLYNLGMSGSSLDNINSKEMIYLLNSLNVNVLFRTEFSNPTGSHSEQIGELGRFVDEVSYSFDKVSLVGHSKGGLVSIGYTTNNPQRVERVITVDTPYSPNEYAKISSDMMDAAYINYVKAQQDYEQAGKWTKGVQKTKLNIAKAAFDKAVYEGTRGSQTDYFKTTGLKDLAGYTNALSDIRNKWNSQYQNGNLASVQSYAIATNSWDGYKVFPTGDMVVSVESQRGSGFNGIFAVTYTVSGDNRNTLNYSHTGITDRDPMINIVGAALGLK